MASGELAPLPDAVKCIIMHAIKHVVMILGRMLLFTGKVEHSCEYFYAEIRDWWRMIFQASLRARKLMASFVSLSIYMYGYGVPNETKSHCSSVHAAIYNRTSYIINSTYVFRPHLAGTKCFNLRARVWVYLMHEAKPSALHNREPIRVHRD